MAAYPGLSSAAVHVATAAAAGRGEWAARGGVMATASAAVSTTWVATTVPPAGDTCGSSYGGYGYGGGGSSSTCGRGVGGAFAGTGHPSVAALTPCALAAAAAASAARPLPPPPPPAAAPTAPPAATVEPPQPHPPPPPALYGPDGRLLPLALSAAAINAAWANAPPPMPAYPRWDAGKGGYIGTLLQWHREGRLALRTDVAAAPTVKAVGMEM